MPQQIVLARTVTEAPVASDFNLAAMSTPQIADGELLVRVVYLSLDPYIMSRLKGRHISGPAPAIGEMIPGIGLGEVVESKAAGFSVGDYIVGETGWRSHANVDAKTARRIDPSLFSPASVHLGVGGMPGLTAYASVMRLAEVKSGDHVLVSSAAGPVGGAVGQIARIQGAEKVVGIAGSDEKCRLVVEQYGFDACINYKKTSWKDDIAAAFPNGINVYHDNIGGDVLMTALSNLANYGRVVLCGLASQYNASVPPPGPNPAAYIVKRAKVMGLVVYDFLGEQDAFASEAAHWIEQGKLVVVEDRAEGLGDAPELFAKLSRGENIGKTVVAVGPERE